MKKIKNDRLMGNWTQLSTGMSFSTSHYFIDYDVMRKQVEERGKTICENVVLHYVDLIDRVFQSSLSVSL